jgi:hypothetical protein
VFFEEFKRVLGAASGEPVPESERINKKWWKIFRKFDRGKKVPFLTRSF